MEKTDGRLSSTVMVLMLCLAWATAAQAAVQDGILVAHCFDDLIDNSGNGHNAVLGGNAYISGGLLYLDGNNDYADIGSSTFGAVNPLVDALSDFTIAVAYACTSTATGEGGSMIVSIGPAAQSQSADLSFGTGNDGQGLDHWYVGGLNSSSTSGVGYANGSVHMVILTYQESPNTYTFYHLTGSGGASHGSGIVDDWSAKWNEAVDYTPRLGAARNATLRSSEEAGFFPDMNGEIDFFAMWNRVLTTAEMEDVMDSCGGGPADSNSPQPDPATWSSPPAALGPYSIEMTATTATDPSGVRYFFEETSGNPGGTDSPWQISRIYTDSTLSPETQYTYKTRSRDQSVNHNETDWSTPPASATTEAVETTPPTPNPATWDSAPSADNAWQISMTATTATDPSGVQYFFDETTGAGHDSVWQGSSYYPDTGLEPGTQHTYQVRARDLSANYNETGWSTPPASATTDEIPTGECPDVDLDDDCDCDIDDLVIFVGQWMDSPPCVGIGDPNGCADLDEENDNVDNEDFAILAGEWQESGVLIPINLVINEIMSNNDTAHPDPADGDYEDWIEIYNAGPLPVNMAGMYLADDGNIWQIPSGVTINAGEYKLFWADNEPEQGIYHTNFALSASGDSVTLYDTDGETILDTVTFGQLSDDISYGRWPNITGDFMNMDDPTPGALNTFGMAGEVYFSRPGGTFTTTFSLGLTTKSPTATIRYTTDDSEPTGSSSLYSGLISVTTTEWIRARAYDSGLDPSPITSGTYIKLDPDVTGFNSHLPIVIINSLGLNIDYQNRDFHPVSAIFIDTDEVTGTCSITDPAEWAGYGGMHIRGASTAGEDFRKKQYRFETWDENSPDPDPGAQYMDLDVSLLGFSAESDWIIHGPFSDNTLMRNYQTYTWSRQIGRYAAKCRFVELFYDKDGASSSLEWDTGADYSTTDYWGVYIFMEKIKRGPDRVDIERLDPSHTSEPEITGGYMLKKDWEWDFIVGGPYYDRLQYEDPRYEELNSTQRNWIENYFDDFESALGSGDYDNPAHANYYGNYIDIDAWIDHHIIVEIAKNVDGFILSTFLSKDRGGKIVMGPVWDYNGAYGANYFCSYDPEGWMHEYDEDVCVDRLSGCGCTGEGSQTFPSDNEWGYRWYECLTTDDEFLLAYADNWFDLREDHFKTANMHADIDNNATFLTTNLNCVGLDNAAGRNFIRWDIDEEVWPDLWGMCHTNTQYMDYVNFLKAWLEARLTWMDGAIDDQYGDAPPVIKVAGVNANRGEHITTTDSISMTSDGGTIFYTTDGSDPRAHGGGIAGTLYSGSFTLSESKQIKARIRISTGDPCNPYDWSALNEATFAVGPVAENLRITEIMYNVNDPNHEYIELKNISGSITIQLNLVKFTDGIDFTFPSTSLSAGDYCVAVRNTVSFNDRYTSFSGLIAGEFVGAINNAGERIELQDALGQTILNFRFKDGWYPITDGDDFSLNIIDPTNPDPNSWEYADYWQPSSVAGGTPSDSDTGHVAAPGDIVINEVMTHTNSYPNDWIELHNTTGSSIDITGWFLSDNDNNFKKYEIQSGDPRANVPDGGYVVFTQDDDFGNASDPGSDVQFAFSELGETVYLCSGSGGELAGGFCTKEDFKASEDEVSFGRHTKSATAGYDVDFVSMAGASSGLPNGSPKVGPIVITEIMYHPPDPNSYAEYVEIKNISGTTVSLTDWLLTDESGGIEYYIPPGTSLTNGSYLLLVKNEVAFNEMFTPAGGVTILEWVEGRLNNAGEKIQISKPGTPEPSGFVPYIRVDRVNYSDGSHGENFRELGYNDPWPTDPDGGGDSLRKTAPLSNYGNDVANWQALVTPTPGS